VAKAIRVMYGASVEPEFVGGVLGLDGVDGLLVGGASINPYKFAAIIDSAYRLQTSKGEEE
jgi:triosephosphate isomerase